MFAYNRRRGRKNKRKILIVLSDGQPATHRAGDIYGYTREVIKAIENKKDVEIYGIGIQTNSVQHLYKKCKVIDDAGQLESAVVDLVGNFILN